MKIAYFDCPTGISGDMLLGSLVDCGVAIGELKNGLALLPIEGFDISVKHVNKAGLVSTQIDVMVSDNVKERKLPEILSIVQKSRLPDRIKENSLGVFQRIGSVEAKIHGMDIDQVHLHELGGLDTIIDVVGVFLGLELLEIEQVYASSLPLARGFIKSAHGTLPLPAPATLALLEGVPVTSSDLNGELVTPTGAALITSLTNNYGNIPAMRILKTGYGAGKRDLPVPNVLRVLMGEVIDSSSFLSPIHEEQLACLECNIDNMNPEIYSYLLENLFNAGALDVSLTPIYMKKNRPGILVTVLCSDEIADKLIEVLFTETTTLGARKYFVDRYSVERYVTQVNTPYGTINVKFSKKGDNTWNYSPEYEDCRRLAMQHEISLMKVYRAAEFAAEEHLKSKFQ